MIYNNYTDIEELLDQDILTEEKELSNIVLFNDDVNTFDWVIECLMKYCGHDSIQSEQCAHIVHFTGRCSVKSGELHKLKPICAALLDKGLSAEIN